MEKIKSFIESDGGKDILIVIILILVGLGSFELGRLSKGSQSEGIKIEYPNTSQANSTLQPANALSALKGSPAVPSNSTSSLQKFFASSKGKKYYSLGCSAGKSIKQENRIYFNTRTEAETAGYTLSTSCK